MVPINIATFKCEWMLSFFRAPQDADRLASPEFPPSFAGVNRGGIVFAPIAHVHGLCERLARAIYAVDADQLFIKEGMPLLEQMQFFVSTFLGGKYAVRRSNPYN